MRPEGGCGSGGNSSRVWDCDAFCFSIVSMVTYAVRSFIFSGSASSRMRCWCIVFRDTTDMVLGEKYGVEWGKGISIPTSWRIWNLYVDEPIILFRFREMIGALLWIALLTSPDIANAVRAVARDCRAPQMVHWKAALYVLFLYVSLVCFLMDIYQS